MDESLLPPPAGDGRPVPWRAIAVAFIPFGALAAGAGLSRAVDSPQGDTVARWLFWSTGAGVALGALWGALLGRAARFIVYGAAAPWLAASLVIAGFRAAGPVREWLADREEAACRQAGRPLCSAREFQAACGRGDGKALGPPVQAWCAGGSCTRRWTYRGPFRPEAAPPRSVLMCSVTEAAGKPPRGSVIAIASP